MTFNEKLFSYYLSTLISLFAFFFSMYVYFTRNDSIEEIQEKLLSLELQEKKPILDFQLNISDEGGETGIILRNVGSSIAKVYRVFILTRNREGDSIQFLGDSEGWNKFINFSDLPKQKIIYTETVGDGFHIPGGDTVYLLRYIDSNRNKEFFKTYRKLSKTELLICYKDSENNIHYSKSPSLQDSDIYLNVCKLDKKK